MASAWLAVPFNPCRQSLILLVPPIIPGIITFSNRSSHYTHVPKQPNFPLLFGGHSIICHRKHTARTPHSFLTLRQMFLLQSLSHVTKLPRYSNSLTFLYINIYILCIVSVCFCIAAYFPVPTFLGFQANVIVETPQCCIQ